MSKYNILFIKTPRTSSTSVRSALSDYCDAKNMKYIIEGGDDFLQHSSKIEGSLGHIPYRPPYLAHLRHIMMENRKLLTITSIRDPLAKMISHYNVDPYLYLLPHIHRTECPYQLLLTRNFDSYRFEKFYLENYKKLDDDKSWKAMMNNSLSYYLGFDTIESITAKNIMNRFDHIIIQEFFDETMNTLEVILNHRLPRRDEQANRPGRSRIDPQGSGFSEEFMETFQRCNKLDYRLYDLCKEVYLT